MFDDVEAYEATDGQLSDDLPHWEALIDELRPRRVLELA